LVSSHTRGGKEQAAVGFEPTNNGFANRRLRPLGYAAENKPVYPGFNLKSLNKKTLVGKKITTNCTVSVYPESKNF
jgi:hypothetical protein